MDDDTLLELVQRQTFSYFWDFAHPVSGLSRERSNVTDYGPEVITIGGSGFGVMSIIVATNRKMDYLRYRSYTIIENFAISSKGRFLSWDISSLVKW